MSDLSFAVNPLHISGNPALTEASCEELRVLLLLVESGGDADYATLSSSACISVARCKSAIAFWEESGVICRRTCGDSVIRYEFDSRLHEDSIDEEPAVKVAGDIRDGQLAGMFEELAGIMEIPCLSQTEIKNLTALHTQYNLNADYICELAAYLRTEGKLTIRRLCNKAIKLCRIDCDTVEALQAYISGNGGERIEAEWELRRLFGIYDRALSQSEKDAFRRWTEDYAFSLPIISEAYDISVLNTKSGRGDVRYMDSILSEWYQKGLTTVAECKAYRTGAKPTAQTAAHADEKKKNAKKSAPTPRYGDFDVQDAFARALERSYGDKD